MKTCVQCGAQLDDAAYYCQNCGAAQPGPQTDVKYDSGADYRRERQTPPPPVGDAPRPQSDDGGKGFAIASLILGILCFIVPVGGLIMAILAVIFGAMARKRLPENQRGMATAGFVLGIIGLALASIIMGFFISFAGCAAVLGNIAAL